MKKSKKHQFFILLIHLNLSALESTTFTSYDQAQTWVRTNPIRGAEYYTDGSGTGYLILNMKGKEYIWEGVPLNVWEGFKQADSFGKYYHRHIKGRYILELN